MRRIAGLVAAVAVLVAWEWVAAGPADVEVKLFQFTPARLEVKTGATVTWANQDDIAHTVTSGTPDSRGGVFDAPLAGQGASARVTFAQPGVYPYFCDRHPSMRG